MSSERAGKCGFEDMAGKCGRGARESAPVDRAGKCGFGDMAGKCAWGHDRTVRLSAKAHDTCIAESKMASNRLS